MERIGIFGGTFNPVHLGHLNCVLTVLKKIKLNKIYVIPARENPLKAFVEGPTAEQRLEMARIGLSGESEQLIIDDQEIKREGPSYTVTTLLDYNKKYSPEQLYLILGADHLHGLSRWRDFEKILQLTNIVFTSRPGNELPLTKEDFPQEIQSFIDVFEKGFAQLKTGRYIEFVQLEDLDISASEVRKKIRTGQSVQKYITGPIERFVNEHELYGPLEAKIGDYKEFAAFCQRSLDARKGLDIKVFDLREISAPSEYAIIASGTSTRHASALAENLIKDVRQEYGVLPQGLEGLQEGRWVLLDYGSLIVHLFYDYVRQEYKLEDLWQKSLRP